MHNCRVTVHSERTLAELGKVVTMFCDGWHWDPDSVSNLRQFGALFQRVTLCRVKVGVKNL